MPISWVKIQQVVGDHLNADRLDELQALAEENISADRDQSGRWRNSGAGCQSGPRVHCRTSRTARWHHRPDFRTIGQVVALSFNADGVVSAIACFAVAQQIIWVVGNRLRALLYTDVYVGRSGFVVAGETSCPRMAGKASVSWSAMLKLLRSTEWRNSADATCGCARITGDCNPKMVAGDMDGMP